MLINKYRVFPDTFVYTVFPDTFVIWMPKGAKILSVQFQPTDHPQLWALVNPDEQPMVNHRFIAVGTGSQLPKEISDFAFVGTF